MGQDNNETANREEERDIGFFTKNWRGASYLNFSRLGVAISELNKIEWDLYFEMVDVIEWENKEIKKAGKAQPGVIPSPPLQGETEKDKIKSMMKPSVRTVRSGRARRH